MNTDTSLAAWMIAGGPRSIDPADSRNLAHRSELAAARDSGPSLVERLSAVLAAWRTPPVTAEPACCPA